MPGDGIELAFCLVVKVRALVAVAKDNRQFRSIFGMRAPGMDMLYRTDIIVIIILRITRTRIILTSRPK